MARHETLLHIILRTGTADEVKEKALEAVTKYTEGRDVRKVIYADRGEKRLVSVVLK